MNTPLFSIITVTFNAETTIGRTLESVNSQKFNDYEHLIIDGSSSDNTLDIVSSFAKNNRYVVSEPDKGIYDAMNKGIGSSRGKYLIFLNAGDKFHSDNTLGLIADTIIVGENPGIVYGQTDLVDDTGKFIAKRHINAPSTLSLKDFSNGMVVCHQAFIVERSIAPYFSLKYKLSADYEWCIMCLMNSKRNIYIDAVIIDYLIEGLTTKHRLDSLKERFRIMCVYYGFFPTLWRHLGFIKRYLRHKKSVKKALNR